MAIDHRDPIAALQPVLHKIGGDIGAMKEGVDGLQTDLMMIERKVGEVADRMTIMEAKDLAARLSGVEGEIRRVEAAGIERAAIAVANGVAEREKLAERIAGLNVNIGRLQLIGGAGATAAVIVFSAVIAKLWGG